MFEASFSWELDGEEIEDSITDVDHLDACF